MSNFADVMNCLTVILKPGFHFNALVEIERFLRRTLPQYEYNNDGLYLDIEPLSVSISEPFFQIDKENKLFLCISFFIRDLWIYDEKEYRRIRGIVAEIAKALKTDEWWYSSEMQGDMYEEFSAIQITEFLETGEHVLEYEDSKNGYSADIIWFVHDKI